MHLQVRTDYAIRMLIHLAATDGTPQSIARISEAYGVSQNHMAKVAQRLRELGYVATVRGRNGGFVLAAEPSTIGVGDLVRQLEEMTLVECFDRSSNRCVITGPCVLRSLLHEAREQFLAVLDAHTLEDLVGSRRPAIARVLKIAP